MAIGNQAGNILKAKVLIYTFRTNQNIEQFLNITGLSLVTPVFVINKPSEDIPKLLDLIKLNKPDWVIGFASVRRGTSRWEGVCQNKFSRGKVGANSPFEVLSLERPDFLGALNDIKTERRIGDTFCNQAAFKVAEYIELEGLRTKSGFLHLRA